MGLINNFFCFKGIFIILFLVSSLFLVPSCISAFSATNVGSYSANLTSVYAPGEFLKGWINISLSKELDSGKIYVKEGNAILANATLGELFNANEANLISGVSYTCEPSSCNEGYSSSTNPVLQKTFTLNSGQDTTFGLKLTGNNVPLMESITMDMHSSASESCFNQLAIDIFNDGVLDWVNPTYNSLSFCSDENYGCYVPSSSTTLINEAKQYCSTFTINSGAAIYVGANVIGSGEATFNFIAGEEAGDECSASISEPGVFGCIINKTIIESENITVCMTKSSGSAYSLYYEDNNPCGYVDFDSSETRHDFSLFIQGLKYSEPGSFLVNLSEIEDSYLLDNYNYNCSAGCYIPVKLISRVNQDINLNSVDLSYESSGISVVNSPANIYTLNLTKPKFTMPFTKLYLDNLNLKISNKSGLHNISVYFEDNEIAKKQIEILNLPSVDFLYPLKVPAGYEITFYASSSSNISNTTSFKWFFGDNSTADTLVPNVKHIYSSVGTNNLVLVISNSFGSVNRSFSIVVESPKEYLNSTLVSYKDKTAELKARISDFPTLVKTYLDNRLNITSYEEKLVSLQNNFINAGNDSSKYIEIVLELNKMSFPDWINFSQAVNGVFLPRQDNMDVNSMSALTQTNYSRDSLALKNAVYSWALSSFEVTGTSKSYSAIYSNNSIDLLTYFNFKFIPLESIERAYFIVASPSATFSWANIQELASGKGFVLDSLDSGVQKNLEFIIPGQKIGLLDAPLYYFPTSEALALVSTSVKCNYNGKCDSSIGETSDNCKSDCKPWSKIFLLWGVVLVIFFILYIIAQEWYKKHYEDHLFKNKDDLYNLINFISNAEEQGLSKPQMYSKLVGKEWHSEQLDFAYHKFKGQRTGMWEIPIFRFWENKKVSKEIEARKNIVNPEVAPKPLIRFQGKINSNPVNDSKQDINQTK
jgi:hypothetical protein